MYSQRRPIVLTVAMCLTFAVTGTAAAGPIFSFAGFSWNSEDNRVPFIALHSFKVLNKKTLLLGFVKKRIQLRTPLQ